MKRWFMLGGIVVAAVLALFVTFKIVRMEKKKSVPPVQVEASRPPDRSEEVRKLAVSHMTTDRLTAIHEASRLTDPSVIFQILRGLAKDENSMVRERAIKAMVNVKHPEVKAVLMDALSDEDVFVPVYAAEALAHMGDFIGKDLAVRMLADVEVPALQISALNVIRLSKDPTKIPAAKKAMLAKDDQVKKIAGETVRALELAKTELMNKQEEEKKKKVAVAELKKSMENYRKRVATDKTFSANERVYKLDQFLVRFKDAGIDVAEIHIERDTQQKGRMQAGLKPAKPTAPKNTTPVTPTSSSPLVPTSRQSPAPRK